MSRPASEAGEPGFLQTAAEREVGARIAEVFTSSSDTVEARLAAFPRYVRRAHITRFLALYELFKLALPVKGSVVECGVFRGFSLMTWAKLSAVLEPNNLMRHVYGFDSFAGFPSIAPQDEPDRSGTHAGGLAGSSEDELRELIDLYDQDRFLGHLPKIHLVPGDMTETIPAFLSENPQLVVSLLYLDADLYDPTRIALELLLPRMPRGAIVAFDELDNHTWPGETTALADTIGIGGLALQRFVFDPYIAYAVVGG